MRNYSEAVQMLNGRNRKKLKNNTYLEKRDNGNVAVRLHNTDIVIYFPDGAIRLDTGGWYTAITKERLNEYTPVHVYQKGKVWYAQTLSEEIEFRNGLIMKDGKFINGLPMGKNNP